MTILKDALSSYVDIQEAVFAYPGNPPLSWHLTPCELDEIRSQLDRVPVRVPEKKVVDWVQGLPNDGKVYARTALATWPLPQVCVDTMKRRQPQQ
jgi:hypothetical protein